MQAPKKAYNHISCGLTGKFCPFQRYCNKKGAYEDNGSSRCPDNPKNSKVGEKNEKAD